MIMGKAIIAHDNPFNSDVLGGAILPFSNRKDLANQINLLESEEELRISCEERNLARAENKYSWDRCFNKHNIAFSAILGQRKGD